MRKVSGNLASELWHHCSGRAVLGFYRGISSLISSADMVEDSTCNREPEVPEGFTVLQEGEARILQHGNDVFYNKAQVVNRDLSIAVLKAYAAWKRNEPPTKGRGFQTKSSIVENGVGGESNGTPSTLTATTQSSYRPLRVLEALAASGLRAIRYAQQVEDIGTVVALDSDKLAVEACQRNIAYNRLPAGAVEAKQGDARAYMLAHEKAFDVVDLDPYGSPSIFLDTAVQTVADGGLLMCTATDMAVLCGNNAEVGWCKYGAYPLRGKYCHEMALRILLACIESRAVCYKRHIVPVLSVSVDFYIRVFVRIHTSASTIKETPSKLSYVYHCVGCESFHLQPVGRVLEKNNNGKRYLPGTGPSVSPACEHCGKHFNMGGPMWSAPMHDPTWVNSILHTATAEKARFPAFDRIHSLLTTVSEELMDVPLYLHLHGITSTLKCTPPAATVFRSAIANAGFRVSGAHSCALGVKTDAPMGVIWDIMRAWVTEHPVKPQPEDSPGAIILAKPATIKANFARSNAARSKAQMNRVARFLPNPEQNWGPKPKAGRVLLSSSSSTLLLLSGTPQPSTSISISATCATTTVPQPPPPHPQPSSSLAEEEEEAGRGGGDNGIIIANDNANNGPAERPAAKRQKTSSGCSAGKTTVEAATVEANNKKNMNAEGDEEEEQGGKEEEEEECKSR